MEYKDLIAAQAASANCASPSLEDSPFDSDNCSINGDDANSDDADSGGGDAVEVVAVRPAQLQSRVLTINGTIRHRRCLQIEGGDTVSFTHNMCPRCASLPAEADFKQRVIRARTAGQHVSQKTNLRCVNSSYAR